jgi:pyruvate,water dikinase
MVDPKIAGVAFSVDTRTGSRRHGIVEYVTGLGNRLVEGSITPQIEMFTKEDISIGDVRLTAIANATVELEHIFGWPVDIEWAWDTKLNIVQLRPLTAIPTDLGDEKVSKLELTHPIYGLPTIIGQSLSRGQVEVRGFISREQARATFSSDAPLWKLPQRLLLVDYTTPDDLPTMEKVAGVVVSKGGVTSHAAIVCREFKKPCMLIKDHSVLNYNSDPTKFSVQKGLLNTSFNSNKAGWYAKK